MDRMSLVVSSCAAVLVALFLQTPAQLGNTVSSYYWILGAQTASVRPVIHSEPSKPAKSREHKAAPVSFEEPAAAGFELPVLSLEAIQPEIPEPILPPPAPPVNVVKANVYLYALNQAESPVVSVLSKGEIVEPQMQVNENGQEWSYVTAPALRISGYLPSDILETR